MALALPSPGVTDCQGIDAWFLTPEERIKAVLRIKENQTGVESNLNWSGLFGSYPPAFLHFTRSLTDLFLDDANKPFSLFVQITWSATSHSEIMICDFGFGMELISLSEVIPITRQGSPPQGFQRHASPPQHPAPHLPPS